MTGTPPDDQDFYARVWDAAHKDDQAWYEQAWEAVQVVRSHDADAWARLVAVGDLHREADAVCARDGEVWPCLTHQVAFPDQPKDPNGDTR